MNKTITIKGKKYLYLNDNDMSELTASKDLSHIWNNYGTTQSDLMFDQDERNNDEQEYINNYINR